MGIAFVIYLADISEPMQYGLRWSGALLSVIMAFVYGVRSMNADLDRYKNGRSKFQLGLFVLGWFLLFAGMMYPTSQGLYKMAGVSAQEKANIDALGNVRP